MGGGGSNSHEPMQFGSVSLDQLCSTIAPSLKQSGRRGGDSGVAKASTDYNSIINDKKEMELVASIIKNRSSILVNWPPQFNDVLDESALCAKEEYLTHEQRKAMEEEKENDNQDKEDKGNLSSSSNGNKKKKKKGVSIMDCIHKYCEMEQLDESDTWYCNQCKEHVRAWKQFHLYRTPPVLIVHLKRFHYSSTTHRRDKIDTLIDFPLVDLDLRSVVKHNHWEVGQEPIYDCYAVSNHFGGLGGGHYTAYARWGNGGKQDKNGEGHGGEEKGGSSSPWCIFDDSRVTTCVDESEVVSNAAYCLYYKRKDVVFDDNDYVVEDNERKIRMSKTTTPTKQQLGVN